MYVAHLSLTDFRSYPTAEVTLEPGPTVFVGPNGQGKTNLVEAICYLATLTSHRVSSDRPLVREGAERAVLRAEAVRDERRALVELEINPGRANRARLNRAPVRRPREILGIVRAVWFAPEDLSLVKGDPETRRRYLDDLLVSRTPRLAGVRQDYDRVLRQRTTLLRSAGPAMRARSGSESLQTLEVWDTHLARAGAELLVARWELLDQLAPLIARAYSEVAPTGGTAAVDYRSSFEVTEDLRSARAVGDCEKALLEALAGRRADELERGVCLVGPHRDDLQLRLGDLPAKGYASHGESWSFALALRLAAYELLGADGGEPILVLDDVFAELDASRRGRLAAVAARAGQSLVTAAVPADVPAELLGARYDVRDGEVHRAGS